MSSALDADERVEKKRLKREAKAEKKALRQRQKLENRMRLDKRPEVRMAAKLEAQEVIDNTLVDKAVEHIVQDDHPTAMPTQKEQADKVVSLMDLSMTQFSLTMISYAPSSILELDLSHNCLSEIPGLSQMKNLVSLDICRNEFRSLPESLRELPHLAQINASRNQLRASADLLVLLTKPPLPSLQSLDLTFNKKLFTQSLLDILSSSLPSVAIFMTVTSPPPKGAYIGNSPGERDPLLLRSQLEPFTTLELRKRWWKHLVMSHIRTMELLLQGEPKLWVCYSQSMQN